jgi:hypothetical protein
MPRRLPIRPAGNPLRSVVARHRAGARPEATTRHPVVPPGQEIERVRGGDGRSGQRGDRHRGGERRERTGDGEGRDEPARHGNSADEGPDQTEPTAPHGGPVTVDVAAPHPDDAERQAGQRDDGQDVQQAEPAVPKVAHGEGAGCDEGHEHHPQPSETTMYGVALDAAEELVCAEQQPGHGGRGV